MKRIDRLLGEARLMRILRAARAQEVISTPADFDWFAEMGCVQALVGDFAEKAMPSDSDDRRQDVIDVLDVSLLVPFMTACVKAISEVYATMAPQKTLADATWPRVCALVAKKRDGLEEPDAGGVRRSAVADLSVLAIQMALFEVVRTAAAKMDLERTVAPNSSPESILIEGGRARRMRRPRRILNADEIAAAALAGLPKPAAILEPPKSASDDGGPNLMTEAMRGVRAARKAAAKSKAEAPKAEPAKAEPSKPEPSKAEQQKTEQTKTDQPKPKPETPPRKPTSGLSAASELR